VSVIIWRTKIHVLWMLAAGGILGWYGLVWEDRTPLEVDKTAIENM
jgi:hypothetical protein